MLTKKFESKYLQSILEDEILLGNEIVEDTKWPPNLNRLLILKYKFSRSYQNKNIEYRKTDDPHYWYEEYKFDKEMISCKFDNL